MNGFAAGRIVGGIVTADGAAVKSTWETPSGSSPYFGWISEIDGTFCTVRIEKIQAVFQNPQRSDQYVIALQGVNLIINTRDLERLMKRLGWTVPKGTV